MIAVWAELKKENYPDYVKKCIKVITSNKETEYWVEKMEVDDYFKRIYFEVDKFKIEMFSEKAWTKMTLYYGFKVWYDGEKFRIGGYETEEITAFTLFDLISKIKNLPSYGRD